MITTQCPNQKVRDLNWHLEMVVSIRPEVVESTLTELEVPLDLSSSSAVLTRSILEYFTVSVYCGTRILLTSLCDELCLGRPDPVVVGITKPWPLLLSPLCDDDLFVVPENEVDSRNCSSPNEIFPTSISGVWEG